MSADSAAPIGEKERAGEPVSRLPPLSGFWRRIAAFGIDGILLGLLGLVIGWPLSSWLFRIGPYGRFIGWPVLLMYFGFFNSSVGRGQTLGKRLLDIAVRDRDGNPISLGRSLFRALILTLPGMLNGWALPLLQSVPALIYIRAVVVLGLGSVMAYTMVLNRQTRQGFHDLVCRTYVVHLSGEPVVAFPRTPRIHWIASAALICLSLVLVIVVGNVQEAQLHSGDWASLYTLHQAYSSDSRFFNVVVSTQGSPARVLAIDAWCKGRPSSEERAELEASLASTALANYEGIDEVHTIRITLISAYDLGIATHRISHSSPQTVEG